MASDRDLLATIQRARRALPETVSDAGAVSQGHFDRITIPEPDADALRDALVAEEARTVIEVGLAYGSSALAIAEALVSVGSKDAAHLIIDAHQEHFDDVGWRALTAAGLADMCTLIRERSQIALPRLLSENFAADAAFVDGSHNFHNVFVDLAFLREIVRPGGVIILDDCQWPSVETATRYFEVNTGWMREPLRGTSRLRAFRLTNPVFEPKFEEFQPFNP